MKKTEKVRVIPLGGLNEIGKNLTLLECGNDIIAIDCGFAFPGDDMPGVDYVIPDMQYIVKNKDRFTALFITHGHEDHIGAIPYLIQQVGHFPIYGTRLTLGILQHKLREFNLAREAELIEVKAGDKVRVGLFEVEMINVNHSIADAVALAVKTPCGYILHTGDFKIDLTPTQGKTIDLARLGELGKEGVYLLLADSTNAERPGFSPSERNVGESLDSIFTKASDKRIIVATFSSNVSRVQQIIDAAVAHGRKVCVSGRSMETILSVASELGYMSIPAGVLQPIENVRNYAPHEVLIITTGSQGEPMSALYRMAYSDHKSVEIGINDLVIISANPIPGNEKTVTKVVNELLKSGAEVVSDRLAEVHVSGHGNSEDLKLLFALTKPTYFMPVHGEYKHLKANAALAKLMGVNPKNIIIADIGNVIELSPTEVKVAGSVPSGKIMVDGLGVGDVGNIVLRDRRLLSQDGLVVVIAVIDELENFLLAEPEVISRGFVYLKDNEQLITDIKNIACDAFDNREFSGRYDEWSSTLKNSLKDSISKYIFEKTKRKPMILIVLNRV